MKRFWGSNKDNTPKPTLDEVNATVDGRVSGLDEKIEKLEKQLRVYREQLKKTRPGAARNTIKQRAMQVLKQKKMYESQRDRMMQHSFNIEQQSFAIQSMKETAITVDAMKDGAKQLKKQFKTMNVDKIEDVMDNLEDLMQDHEEIQEALGRSYGGLEDVDEDDLEAELDALGDELFEEESQAVSEPSYLSAASTVAESESPSALEGLPTTATNDFELPEPPQTVM